MPASLEIPTRSEVISKHKGRGGRVAAVFPIHYPRALFRAFNVLPVEVWGPPKVEARQGEAHLQSYTCSIVRNGLSFILSGGLNVADFIVVPASHTFIMNHREVAEQVVYFLREGRFDHDAD